jgi:hypothetical protein
MLSPLIEARAGLAVRRRSTARTIGTDRGTAIMPLGWDFHLLIGSHRLVVLIGI